MDAVVDRYFPVLDAIETELEAIEEPHLRPHLPRATTIEAALYIREAESDSR